MEPSDNREVSRGRDEYRLKVGGVVVACQTIVELVNGIGRTAPKDAGIEIDGRFLSYAAISALSQQVAGNLQQAGLKAGDRVCSLMSTRLDVLLT